MEFEEAFNKRVLQWVKLRDPEATIVTKVEDQYLDMLGDTIGGFYSRFEVHIRYDRGDGTHHFLSVEDEDMQSLWRWVVNNDVWEDK